MSNVLLAIDDWAGNIINDYKPMVDGGVKISINRLGQGDAFNNTGESNGTGDWLYKKHTEDSKLNNLLNETYYVVDPICTWQSQVDWVIKNWKPQYDDLPFVADIELTRGLSGNQLIKLYGNFLGNFEAYFHEKPMIYTGKYWFWQTYMVDNYGNLPSWQTEYDFWLAQYPLASSPRYIITWDQLKQYYPIGWPTPINALNNGVSMRPVAGWQWSGDKMILPGISGPIDLSFFPVDWVNSHLRGNINPPPIIPPTPTFQPYAAMINAFLGLNIRTGPGITYNKISAIPYFTGIKRTVITILDENNGWGKVDYNNYSGWVNLSYVTKI